MMFFWKKPKYETKDKALYGLSIMFHSYEEDPIFKSELLNPKHFDYSISSLQYVDEYLENIRDENGIENEWNKIVLRVGAYVGEVIRKNDKKNRWHWVDYETANKLDPDAWKDTESDILISAMLYENNKSFCFPIKKVHKFLINGTEDSVKVFAEVMLKSKELYY